MFLFCIILIFSIFLFEILRLYIIVLEIYAILKLQNTFTQGKKLVLLLLPIVVFKLNFFLSQII